MCLNYSLEVEHDNRHKTMWMPTSCPMGVLDVLCLDDEGNMPPSFRRMMCCVPKGRAIVLSGFYGKTESSNCSNNDDDNWGLSSFDSERLLVELGDKYLPSLSMQSLSVQEEMIGHHRNSFYEELQNCILNMVPTRRQLLLVFRTTQEACSDYDVEQLNNLYWEVTTSLCSKNNEVSRST